MCECSPTAPRGGRWCTPGTSPQRSSIALEAPVDKVHCRAYNVGTEANNLTVAEIAQSGRRCGARREAVDHRRIGPRSAIVPSGLLGVPQRARLRSGVVDSRRCRRTLSGVHLGRAHRRRISPRSSPGCPTWKHCATTVFSTNRCEEDHARCVSSSAQLPAPASRGETADTGSGQSIARSGSL